MKDENLDREIEFLKVATLASNATSILEKRVTAENYGISLVAFHDLFDSYIEAKKGCQDESVNIIMYSLVSLYRRVVRVIMSDIAKEADEYFGETIASDIYSSIVRLLESYETSGVKALEQLGHRMCHFVEIMNKSEITFDSRAIYETEMESLEELFMLLVKNEGADIRD